jgi:pSer/pThr/pTyr-binding forkhead associated (FHA) protein
MIAVSLQAENEASEGAALVLEEGVTVGCTSVADVHVEGAGIADIHAHVSVEDDTYYIVDRGTPGGTFLNNQRLKPNHRHQLHPGDFVSFGKNAGDAGTLKVKCLHDSQRDVGLLYRTASGDFTRMKVTSKVPAA